MKKAKLLLYFASIIIAFVYSSCEEIDPKPVVPSYLKIEKISVKKDDTFGSNSSKIFDAWVYVDNEFIGAFELPATVPVLKSGKHTVFVRAGIAINAIFATRGAYEFYEGYTANNVELTEGKTTTLSPDPVVTYKSITKMIWNETFESGISIDTTPSGNTAIHLIMDSTKVFEKGKNSAVITLDATHDYFEAVSHDNFTFPSIGATVFLEINYRAENDFSIGIAANTSAGSAARTYITLKETGTEWKKAYIELTRFVNEASISASSYSIVFSAQKSSPASSASIYLDNIKLLHF